MPTGNISCLILITYRFLFKRFILASITVNSKHYLDDSYENKIYAKCGGISASELSEDEMEYLNLINYRLYVDEEDFNSYVTRLDNYILKFGKIPKGFAAEKRERMNIEVTIFRDPENIQKKSKSSEYVDTINSNSNYQEVLNSAHILLSSTKNKEYILNM